MDERATLAYTDLRYVFSGGESLGVELQNRLHETLAADLYNVYGPTEATIDCTYWHCSRGAQPRPAPIGRPTGNAQIYLLNQHLDLVPIGVAGEIFIGGSGLARGYASDPCLTAEKFVPCPFGQTPGARMYRSGDLSRQNADGVLDFIGRADEQVKIRGFRVELGEIERALLLHQGSNEAAVTLTRGPSGEPRITAYLSFGRDSEVPSSAALTEFLSQRLPVYMLPELYITLESLPRTRNGKIDRRALPLPEDIEADPARLFIGPRTPLEAEVAKIVATVLGLERVSVEADLFTLGCNSLLMSRITSRLSSAYQINMPVPQFFKDPTVVGLARLIDGYQRTGQQGVAPAWTLEQLEAEAAIDSAITAEGLPVADYCSPRHIFLTGVTGYLGAFLLEQLLCETSADIYCLVRASEEADGHRRIQQTLESYQIWQDSYRERIFPVIGDLAKPRLGLSEAEFTALAETADVIYHSGALVNFVYPYSALKAPNVQGTHEVIRLSCREKLKAIHYVSTVDVLLGTHTHRPFFENDQVLNDPAEIPDGYARSKWVAEKMLATARSRGVPVCVYRPGLIMGHTQTGATQTNDYLLVMLRGYIDLGILPEPDIMIDFVTVDYVAKVISQLSRKPDSIGKYFHIWNPRPVHMSEAYKWIRSFGYELEIVPLPVLRKSVLAVDSSNALYPFVAGFRDRTEAPAPALSHDPRVVKNIDIYSECKNTFAGIADNGTDCPTLTEEMAHHCFAYLAGIGFLPQPVQ
jgi:thioester reductase-like protein